MRFQTRAVHAGQEPDEATGAVVGPIYQNVTFQMDEPGVHRGFDYLRTVNPTRSSLEQCLAELEGASHSVCFSSGMAATGAIGSMLRPGDHVVASLHLYAGTHRYLSKILAPYGIECSFVQTENSEAVQAAVTEDTRLIWVETPSNPLVTLSDIRAIADVAQAREDPPLLVVDSTMASPFGQHPLELGADIVLHSTTKYISGHLDVLGGVLLTSRQDLYDAVFAFQNATGPTPSPFDNWLTLRGVRTLGLRMRAHQEAAMAVATVLDSHPAVEWVHYPGLESHPQRELAERQMSSFSGMICASLRGGIPAAKQFLGGLKLFTLAESLGGAQSLISHPPTMTHAPLSPEERAAQAVSDGLLRLSVGLEDPADLVEDVTRALEPLS